VIKKVILKANCSREKERSASLKVYIYLYLIGLFFIDPIYIYIFFFFLKKNSILEEELNIQRFCMLFVPS
jgi:hypothetical protein